MVGTFWSCRHKTSNYVDLLFFRGQARRIESALIEKKARKLTTNNIMASNDEVDLETRYAAIKSAQPQQQAKYAEWLKSGAVDTAALSAACDKLGLVLDADGGQISYKDGPASARFGGGAGGGKLCYDLMYVRHGKTTGNTEPRVFQGYVDEETNALNEIGLGQAEEAADKVVFFLKFVLARDDFLNTLHLL